MLSITWVVGGEGHPLIRLGAQPGEDSVPAELADGAVEVCRGFGVTTGMATPCFADHRASPTTGSAAVVGGSAQDEVLRWSWPR